MREVGTFEAKNTLSALLDLVERGEEVVITRHGKPVARLVSPGATHDPAAAAAAIRDLRQRGKKLGLGRFDWAEWKAYRDEGRR